MLYADDAGVVSTSPRGLTRMMGVIVVTYQEFGLTVSEKKNEAMHLWSHPHTASSALRIEAAGQRYKQTTEFVYLGGAISESADLDIEIKRRIGAAWASVRKYSSQLYDRRNARLSLKIRLFKAEVMEAMLYGCARGLCAPRTLAAYVLPTTSYSCALSAFGARTASGINPSRIGRFSRGPVPNASKRQFGSANLGSPGPLSDKATQDSQSESYLGGWRLKGPSEEVDRRRRGWTASRKITRPSGRSRSKAKKGSGSHSELLSRMDGIGSLLRRTWASGTRGSRGEPKHSTVPGDARTFVNPTCSASARLVKLYSNYVCDFVLLCLIAVVSRCFSPLDIP